MKKLALTLAFTLGLAPVIWAESYDIDAAHSSVSFTVKHVVGKVMGHFDKFAGNFTYSKDTLSNLTAQATIDANSINTGIDKRDAHLRSADFFDVQKYPNITFKSTKVTDVQGNKAKLAGDLTMHGVTKPIVLDLEMAGPVNDPMGKGMRAGATATGKLNRSDFNVGPSSGPLSGMVGSDIGITIEIEGLSAAAKK